MSRIVLVTAGSFGDLFPTLGLARALQARGHRPVVATSPHYRARIEADGLEFASIGPDIDPSDPAILAGAMHPARGSEFVIRELVIPHLRQSYQELLPICEDADVIVSHPITFAVPLLAAKLHKRWLSTVLAPISFFSLHDFPVLPPFPGFMRWVRRRMWATRFFFGVAQRATRPWTEPWRAFRAELGLPPGPDALYRGQFSPFGTLALYSSVLGGPQPDWPEHVHVTGFVFYGDQAPMPADLSAFLDAGEPPIVFTLGSTAVGVAGEFYRASAQAAASLGRRAVLLVGKHDVNRADKLPQGVIEINYAPHGQLFARAAAIVHHGGVGTTGRALESGRPMVVVPHAHDQPDNAFRVEQLGVSRTLYPQDYRADRVARNLEIVLLDPAFAAKAAETGAIVRSEKGADRACEEIEKRLAV